MNGKFKYFDIVCITRTVKSKRYSLIEPKAYIKVKEKDKEKEKEKVGLWDWSVLKFIKKKLRVTWIDVLNAFE